MERMVGRHEFLLGVQNGPVGGPGVVDCDSRKKREFAKNPDAYVSARQTVDDYIEK